MIYLLTRYDTGGYDMYDAKVVRAKCEYRARELANMHVGDEGKIWQNKHLVRCRAMSSSGEECIILESFNAG